MVFCDGSLSWLMWGVNISVRAGESQFDLRFPYSFFVLTESYLYMLHLQKVDCLRTSEADEK